ncbi:heavy metal translocating P-type ATPase metal-binding domain-containing protein [bacterium]|nr:heavy metal translocating P-type ATPase metal-binding domain-containing protein [bacterium]
MAPGKCIHCGLDLGASHDPGQGPFCCHGCRTVYQLINETGLERFYDLRPGSLAPPPDLRPDNLAWLELMLADPDNDLGDGLVRLRLDLQGVHCAACVWLLEQLFARRSAGRSLIINPALGTVELMWDTRLGALGEYLAEAERFGYRFGPPRKSRRRGSRSLQIRMGIAISVALNVMMYSLGYYFGLSPQDDGPAYVLFGRLSFVLSGLVVAIGGWPFFTSAWRGLRRRVAHLDLPIALGMLLGYAGSTVAYFREGPAAAYFDTISIFVALMLVGRWLQEWVLEKNRNALLESGGIADLYARRFQDGRLRAVPAAEIVGGDEIWISPGDLVPVDGVLMRSDAIISLDWITGESAPQHREPGEKMPAGAFNAGEQGFRVAAVEDFSDSRLHGLLRVGAEQREEGRGWWHKISTVYVTAVLLLAVGGFLIWSGEGLGKAIEVAVAVLVVTCPCALGLAVPLARELVHVALRRHGVLLRSGSYLDRALRIRKILFDKTGTLTRGKLMLADPSRRGLLALPAAQRGILWNMTSRSNHPASRCVAAALGLAGGATDPDGAVLDPRADGVREIGGHGLQWEDEAGVWRFGRAAFALPDGHAETIPTDRTFFSLDGNCLLGLTFAEEMKPDARAEVASLAAAGYEVHLLSGDAPGRVLEAAGELGLPAARARGGLTPESKAAAVRALDADDTLMIGDGLNDSPSFDAAWCAATPAIDRAVLSHKADFYYLGDGVSAVRRTLQAAGRLRTVQRGNLVFAAVYNTAAVALCLSGLVTPVVAAVLMPLSSVTVVSLTAARLAGGRSTWMS